MSITHCRLTLMAQRLIVTKAQRLIVTEALRLTGGGSQYEYSFMDTEWGNAQWRYSLYPLRDGGWSGERWRPARTRTPGTPGEWVECRPSFTRLLVALTLGA